MNSQTWAAPDRARLPFIEAPWSDQLSLFAGTTTRAGGCSEPPFDDGSGGPGLNLAHHVGDEATAVAANRALLSRLLPTPAFWLNQIHGTDVIDASGWPAVVSEPAGAPPNADAAVTRTPGQVLAIMTADCLPVLLVDRDAGVIGAAHAGWRGLAAGVLTNTMAAMEELGASSGSIDAWIGPAIGPTAFEVGAEVPAAFAESASFRNVESGDFFRKKVDRAGKWLGDLPGLAAAQMLSAGIGTVTGGEHCTVRDARFYSYRRDGQTGRMVSLIHLGRA